MPTLHISPTFRNDCPGTRRVSYQFIVSGTKQQGVVYVTGLQLGMSKQRACDIACKRAGATEATLCAIVHPVR